MSTCSIRLTRWAVALALVCFLLPHEAHAYVDPGTGSYVLQLALAMVFGAIYSVKVYWRDLRHLIHRKTGRERRVSS